jgi:integrative and conjugative element protein (TIGR02256 family)
VTERADGILIARSAVDAATADGTAALPNETGGILLGFRTPNLIVVTRALTVADPRSSRNQYTRNHRRARARMDFDRGNAPPVVGYVGEWHTHPADVGPSWIDRHALSETARLAEGPLALIVLADPSAGPAHIYGAIAARRTIWPYDFLNPVEVTDARISVTNDTAASLEAEAAALTVRRSRER